jgi:D-alanyl-D-alanine carboxypeptidase
MRFFGRLSIAAVVACAISPTASALVPVIPAKSASVDTTVLRAAIQARLDSFRVAGRFPGATLGVALPDGTIVSFATGESDTARHTKMTVTARMPQGSVGKTYYAAVALALIGEGKLDPDALASRYLGEREWWRRIPNADSIRVRDLLRHTSGVMRYEFKDVFLQDLTREPYRKRKPEELLAYVFDEKPPFAAGQGWDYSDTNYFLIGLIVEKLTGAPLQDEVKRRLLDPLKLSNTVPNASPVIPGIVQGYAGPQNPFGGKDAVIGDDGRMTFDPAFEWAGGGYSSTASDLAHWAKLLYEGKAVDAALINRAVAAAVPARMLGPGAKYGFGVIVRDSITGASQLGASWGHSGFFPGYHTEMRYYTTPRVAVAVMVNSSTNGIFGRGQTPGVLANDVARIVADEYKARE